MVNIDELYLAFRSSTGVCTDTRTLLEGGMFFALKGPNFDANSFSEKALDSGCSCAVVDDASVVKSERFLLVPDVLKALQELGQHHRRQFNVPVIAITGTNGKTTTKELTHAVLSAHAPTLATIGNLNNHIGVPLTLLRMTRDHRFAIIEMGANHIGDIAELTAIAEPTHGMVTNIGKAHLEGFGGFEGVVRAKSEMYDHLTSEQGTVFVNSDDELLMRKTEGMDRVTYGTISSPPPFLLGNEEGSAGPYLSCRIVHDDQNGLIATRLIGSYNLPNVLAAACIGFYFGIQGKLVFDALAAYEPTNNRSQFKDTGRNQLVLDAYNANPSSMKVALENFAAMRSDRSKLAILGGMKELGAASRSEHSGIVELASKLGLKCIFVGPEFMELENMGITVHLDANAALDAFMQKPLTGQLILVKGSRGTKLESLLPGL